MSPPRIVIVAQAFKESLSATEVRQALEGAVRAVGGDPVAFIGSDGGDGLLEALAPALQRRTAHQVVGPLLQPIAAPIGWLDAVTAVIESRLICGLSLLSPDARDPRVTTSRGVGALVQCAVLEGAARVYLGLGGSATMDGGLGMARAWGWEALDAAGAPIPEGGAGLARLARLAPGERPATDVVGLCDVSNPLTGPRGARVFAAQKGATRQAGDQLAAGLERLAALAVAEGYGDLASRAGAGAAGGLGFGILCFARGKLVPGAPWVLERLGFVDSLGGAQLVITAEASFDRTSLEGKLSGVVLSMARDRGVPAILLSPHSADVPQGVIVESGGGWWTADDLRRRTEAVVARALRLLRF